MLSTTFPISLLLIVLGGVPSSQTPTLLRLTAYLTGSFSSQEQSAADTTFADVRLRMVPVWKNRSDGPWLYVEQAMADKQERPYRQRVYHLAQRSDTTFESLVFTLPDPLRFAGDWRKENPLATLSPDSLTIRNGCSILLHPQEEKFTGGTVGRGCPSELRGAAYATSAVVLTETVMVSWDRGFNKDGTQVWGSIRGGYIFKRVPDR